jgi:hypothetical protein
MQHHKYNINTSHNSSTQTAVGAQSAMGATKYFPVEAVPTMRADASTHGVLLSTANGLTRAGTSKKESGYITFVTDRRYSA